MNQNYYYYPQETQGIVQPKKKSPKVLIAVIAAVAVLALAAGIAALVILNNPMVKVGRSLNASLRAASSGEAAKTFTDTLETGSVEFEADLSTLTANLIGQSVDAGMRVKTYFNTKNSSEFAAEASLSLKNSEALDLGFYTDGDSAAVRSEAIFGKKSYGLKFKDVEKKFDDSAFGPDGKYSLGLDGDELSEILDLFSSAKEQGEKGKKLVENKVKDLLSILNKYAKTTKSGGTLDAGDITVKTDDVSMKLSEDDIRKVFMEMLDYVRKDKDIRSFLKETLDQHGEIMGIDMDIDDLYDELDDAYDELEDMDEDEFEDTELEAVFRISKKNGQLVGLNIEIEAEDEEITVETVCAPDWKSPAYIRILCDADYLYSPSLDVVYSASDEADEYNADLSVKISSDEDFRVTLNWDRKDTGFTVKFFSDGDEQFTLKGDCEKKSGVTSIRLKSIEISGFVLKLNGISMTVKEKDKLPVIKGFEDVLTMDEDDIDSIMEDVEEFGEEFVGDIGDIGEILGELMYMFY